MPKKLFDENGNEVLAYTEDEVKAKDDSLSEYQTKLKDLEDKSINFKNFKDLTEEEKKKLTAAQLAERERAERLETQIADLKKNASEETLRSMITASGLNEVDGKKVLEYMNIIKDEPALGLDSNTADGLRKKFELAKNAAGPVLTQKPNPLFAAGGNSGFGLDTGADNGDWTQSETFTKLSNKLTGK